MVYCFRSIFREKKADWQNSVHPGDAQTTTLLVTMVGFCGAGAGADADASAGVISWASQPVEIFNKNYENIFVVYIEPQQWSHGTINTRATVGISVDVGLFQGFQ
jgi:hypothetical protein